MKLISEQTGFEVKPGEYVVTRKGENGTLAYTDEVNKRVFIQFGGETSPREYFPEVIGCRFVADEPAPAVTSSVPVPAPKRTRAPRGSRPPRPPSRPVRWADAVGKVKDALSAISTAMGELEAATAELEEIRQEYAEWNGNLSDNLRNSAVGEKLQAIEDMDVESIHSELQSAFDEAEGKADELENADLPQGFGRD